MSIDELTTSGESEGRDDFAGQNRWPGGRKLGATILRRLAEAVRGFPKRDHLWFVGPLKYDPAVGGHRLTGPFPDYREAEEHFEAANHSYDTHHIFGPFDGRSSGGSVGARKSWRVTGVVLHLTDSATGATREIDIDPNLNDAVFWQQPGVEKFLVPYYTAIGSLKEGETVRDAMASTHTAALIHRISSEWVEGRKVRDTSNITGWEGGMGLFKIASEGDDRAELHVVPAV